ncbi:MAG: spermidine synthase, partial [Oscillospiraceae bacterium]
SGHWLFGFASKKYHPVLDQNADWWVEQGLKTHYYNRFVHSGCFALPQNVRDVLRETPKE